MPRFFNVIIRIYKSIAILTSNQNKRIAYIQLPKPLYEAFILVSPFFNEYTLLFL
ncbi:hypothetical protein SAMN02745131_00684 [Flavisolibacter ginsengisoli DSM 18119]|jgi:hypothetical protein|uniref:Uncharacterized protein n=1 Tax=Flavisolibacter ginsengisoli DSM 18119 TaxID=1121884 RepID=A0A1M4UK95_9BACT|nr:hypothetical protein SAMN02745131_00684 [Flavisolibacter ginsengisoli DSM 18119]